MFSPMRRKKQQLPREEVISLLDSCSTGILAVNTPEGYPYTIPVNYVYYQERVYFHCGKKGLKIDALSFSPKVSMCIVAKDKVLPQDFATDYASLILFGKAHIVEEDDLKRDALKALNAKFSADYPKEGDETIRKSWKAVSIVEIEIEQITGKVSRNSDS